MTGPANPAQDARLLRSDRLYVGWQYALLHPDPGPSPKRPSPPKSEGLNPHWVAAQRREERLLNRPLKAASVAALAGALLFVIVGAAGGMPGLFAAAAVVACLVVAAFTGVALWQGEQAVRARINEERNRLERIRADRDRRLFAAQEEHARQYQAWRERHALFTGQHCWYAVALPYEVDRIDVAGGTLSGWSALITLMAATRLHAGGTVTMLDLSEGAVAKDLAEVARRLGDEPQVWVLPVDLPRLDLGATLDTEALADVLSLVISVSEEQSTTRDLSFDNAILERVLEVFPRRASVGQVTAALRALAQVGDPRDDLRQGLLTSDQLERIGTLFGRGSSDRVVIERAWALESQLRKLETLGTRVAPLPPARLRVLSTDRHAGIFTNKVLGTYVATALTHVLRQAPVGRRWQHTLLVAGADKLRGDVLDRLFDACESSRTGLLLSYRSLPQHVKERLGRGNAAVAYMRLGNAEDAQAAAEQIGQQHRFVLAQLTETIGSSVTDAVGDAYTSTVGASDATSTSTTTSTTRGQRRSRGRTDDWVLGLGDSTWSRGKDASSQYGTAAGETFAEGITKSTAWGRTTSRAIGGSESLTRSVQRSREFLVEPHELQQLPPTAVIVTHATSVGRRVILADTNPALIALPAATTTPLEELHEPPASPAASFDTVATGGGYDGATAPAGTAPAGTGSAGAAPADGAKDESAPNLGPPPQRLDWRKR